MNLETSRAKVSGFFDSCNYFIKFFSKILKISYEVDANSLISASLSIAGVRHLYDAEPPLHGWIGCEERRSDLKIWIKIRGYII